MTDAYEHYIVSLSDSVEVVRAIRSITRTKKREEHVSRSALDLLFLTSEMAKGQTQRRTIVAT
jgi:hypothetical protein